MTPAGDRWTSRGWLGSILATGAIGALMAGYLLVRTRREWFFIDEWEFLALRVGPHPAVGIMIPHNEHPSMLPILVWRVLFDVFGIQHYWPYMGVLIVAQLVVVALVWLAARRCGAGPVGAAAAAAVMATAGIGAEDVIWAFQIGMVGSLAASWAGALLTDRPRGANGPGRLVATWVVLIAGLACSAVSVPLLMLTVVVAGARRGWRAAVLAVSVPAVVFLAWYLHWGRDGVNASPGFKPQFLASYVITGLDSALDGLTGVPGTAAVVVLLVLLGTRSGMLTSRTRAPAAAGLVGAIALFMFISVGRAGLGDAQAQSSRYAYLATALVLPAAAAGAGALVRRPTVVGDGRAARRNRGLLRNQRFSWLVVGVCTVGICGRGLGLLDTAIASRVVIGTGVRTVASAGNALVAEGGPLLSKVGSSKYSGHLDGAALIRLHDLGKLRGLRHPTPVTLAQSRLVFQFRYQSVMSRAALAAAAGPPAAAMVQMYLPARHELNPVAVPVSVKPFATPPTVLTGRAAANPAALPAALGCVSTAPTAGAVDVQLTPAPGGQAVLILVAGTTLLRYGWGGGADPVAANAVPMTSGVVGELTTIVGHGKIRLSADSKLTLCPVA